MQYPANLRYTRSDEWLLPEGDLITVGITQYAANELGDLVYIELPEVGKTVEKGNMIAVLESVKAVGEIYAPIGGKIVSVNEEIVVATERVSESPYGAGWLLKLRAIGTIDWSETLSPEEYATYRA